MRLRDWEFAITMDDNLNHPELALSPEIPQKPSGLFNALSWIRDLAFSVLIAVILIVFIYQPVKVEGTSMMPSLTDQERIFINKFTYRFGIGNIERGDMVVFWFPQDKTQDRYIKRVIGLPGDMVEIDQRAGDRQRQALRGELRAGRVSRPHFLPGAPGSADQLLRAGRPSQLLERQPHLGLRGAQVYLRQGCVRVLAAWTRWAACDVAQSSGACRDSSRARR